MRIPATVVPYDPRWRELFVSLRLRVDAALSAIPHETIHVGSTAVPGLAAKPIIDLDVVVPEQALIAQAIAALAATGWRHNGDQGIPGREAFEPVPDLPYHHLYLVVADSTAYHDHVDLLDYLRTHPAERERYAALKLSLAPLLASDREAYVAGKADLVAEILKLARQPGAVAGGPEHRSQPTPPALGARGDPCPEHGH
jgi:GrpB-like predicted nucleotidyltransferase (UPF0157 family)